MALDLKRLRTDFAAAAKDGKISDTEVEGLLRRVRRDASTFGESSNAKYTNSGLFADHAYSVWGTEVSGGQKYVQLRNPWGDTEPANNGRDDGIFKMELGAFMKMYANVEINGG